MSTETLREDTQGKRESVPPKSEPHIQLSTNYQLSSRERTTLVVVNTLADCGTRVYWPLV